MSFKFRQFAVNDEKSSMKVGTDSTLLGAWAHLNKSKKILDIGCGSGLLSLMAAQKSIAKITAIDIDKESIEQANSNFENSKWSNRLTALNISLQNYCLISSLKSFDTILSNPPYFVNSLKSNNIRMNYARHSDALPFEHFAKAADYLTDDFGTVNVILPIVESFVFISEMKNCNFSVSRKTFVFPSPGKKASRALISFKKCAFADNIIDNLYIRNSDNNYSDDYKLLTRDFYLNF